jgi:5'(3')-deoxyribonucleotidase
MDRKNNYRSRRETAVQLVWNASLEEMKRIAMDMDEVMADTMGRCLTLYNAEFNRELRADQFHGRRLWDVIEESHWPQVRGYFNSAEFFASIELMQDSQEVVRELSEKYEIYVVSAAMDVPCSFAAKFEWLQKYFPFIPTDNIVFCGSKGVILADYLIDDNLRQLKSFQGEGIIFTAPHNVNETAYRRVNSWQDVRTMFLS